MKSSSRPRSVTTWPSTGSDERRGQRAIPHDFSPAALVRSTEAALKRLKTDRIDLLQLHNIGLEQVDDDAVWETLEGLVTDGKIRYYGFALGPAIGWLYEGIRGIEKRPVTSVQHIYNMLEAHPGAALHETARATGRDTMFLIRVTHSSGMLEGRYTEETVFPAQRSSQSSATLVAAQRHQENRSAAVFGRAGPHAWTGRAALALGG